MPTAQDVLTALDSTTRQPLAWLFLGVAVVAGAIAWFTRRRRAIDRILGGAPHRRKIFHPAYAKRPLSVLEGELKQKVFDPAARERLIKDAMQRRRVDRNTALRIVLEELDSEHRRYD